MGFNGILMGYMMVIINTLRHRPYIDLIIYIYIYTIWLWHSQFAMVGIDGPNRNRWSSQRTKYQRSIYLWIFHGELWISHNQMVWIYTMKSHFPMVFLWFFLWGPKKNGMYLQFDPWPWHLSSLLLQPTWSLSIAAHGKKIPARMVNKTMGKSTKKWMI